MFESLKKQFPKGLAWTLPSGYIRDLIEALAIEPQRIADFLRGIVTESNPGTSIELQEEWFEQFGIAYDPAGAISEKQKTTLGRYVALGAQDIVYFQRLINDSGFPTIILSETFPFVEEIDESDFSVVSGTIDLNEIFSPDGADDGALVTSTDPDTEIREAIIPGGAIEGKHYIFSIYIKNKSVLSKRIRLRLIDLVLPAWFDKEYTITDEWQKYEVSFTFPSGVGTTVNCRCKALEVDGLEEFYYWGGKLVETTGTFSPAEDVFKFNLDGTLNFTEGIEELEALVQRISPAHCFPEYNIVLSGNVYGVAICGVGTCSAN
jgi:hypothetical protein